MRALSKLALITVAVAGLCVAGCGPSKGTITWSGVAANDNTTTTATTASTNSTIPTNNGGSTTTGPTPFNGTWITSYGDDQTGEGAKQYAVILALVQNPTTNALSGSGTMIRLYRSGTISKDTVYFVVSNGSASGSSGQDGTMTFVASSGGGQFDINPVWYLRVAGNQMTGIYQELDSNSLLVVSGHTDWNLVSTAELANMWAASYEDAFATSGLTVNDTSGLTTLALGSSNSVTGDGLLAIQHEGIAAPDEYTFSAVGNLSSNQLTLNFINGNLTNIPMIWYGFVSSSLFAGAYDQFSGQTLSRFGHGTWYSASSTSPDTVSNTWVTSCGDSVSVSGVALSDYVMEASLTLQNNNTVTGSAAVLSELDATPQYRAYTVQNGTISGNRVQFSLVGAASTFVWDTNLTDTGLTGSYQQFSGGKFVSRGIGQWQFGTSSSLVGVWTSAYVDTVRPGSTVATQLSRVVITSENASGALTGTATVRFAGQAPRDNSVSGTQTGDIVEWDFPDGTGLNYTWHFRQAGGILFGSYTDRNSADSVEARGHAIWYRSSLSTTP